MDVRDGVAVVTGGASGIGRAAALRLAAFGCDVLLADVHEAGLAETARQVLSHGGNAVSVHCDVTSDHDIARLAATASTQPRPVRVVMANAGVAAGGQLEHVPISEWTRVLDVNVIGVARTVRAFLPDLIEARTGVIVITSSVLGLRSERADMTPYITSKAALVGMARSLAAYTRPLGVNVILLCPALTATPFPGSVRMWGPHGRVPTTTTVPQSADAPDLVADLLIDAIRSDHLLASPVLDLARELARWAADPDSTLPPLRGGPAQTREA
jgi:NAD(P)-dependent dehydrogenase (short-subunit alcohol dehydrogenase family)